MLPCKHPHTRLHLGIPHGPSKPAGVTTMCITPSKACMCKRLHLPVRQKPSNEGAQDTSKHDHKPHPDPIVPRVGPVLEYYEGGKPRPQCIAWYVPDRTSQNEQPEWPQLHQIAEHLLCGREGDGEGQGEREGGRIIWILVTWSASSLHLCMQGRTWGREGSRLPYPNHYSPTFHSLSPQFQASIWIDSLCRQVWDPQSFRA